MRFRGVDCCISMLASWVETEAFFEGMRRQSQDGHGRWGNIQFSANVPAQSDVWLAINSPRLHSGMMQEHDPSRTLVWNVEHSQANWRRLYGYDSLSDNPLYLKTISHADRLNWGEFHLSEGYTDLKFAQPSKDSDLSVIVSSVTELPMQKKRVEFLKYLEGRDLSFLRSGLDVYGRDNMQNFKSYRGSLPAYSKGRGLARYRYHIAVEAAREINYITEKLFDPLLHHCLVFYDGCPNIGDWFDERSVIIIDLDDFAGSFETIKRTIMSNEWERRAEAISEARQLVLDRYNVFPAVRQILGL